MTSLTGLRGSATRATLVLVLTLAAATAAAPAASHSPGTAGKLGFEVTLRQSGPFTLPCPGGVPDLGAPPTSACVPFTGAASVRGLGAVSLTHTELFAFGPPACSGDSSKPMATTGHLGVVGKGDISVAFVEGARCTTSWLLPEPLEFTITGGTGRFVGASGKGTRELSIAPTGPAQEIWTGTLEVPGLVFDLTAPRLHGTDAKAVQAPKGATSARVTFEVTAADDVEGAIPASCTPRSGSRFALGKTRVRCSASDSSGNTARTAFSVTVKRGR